MALTEHDVCRVDRCFLKLPRESQPTMFYAATIRRFTDPKNIFTFWEAFAVVDEAVQLQSTMVARMGPELASEIALDYHPHLNHRRSVLVTGLSDCILLEWAIGLLIVIAQLYSP